MSTDIKRPIISVDEFERAFELARLSDIEQKMIDFIRYVGVFNQTILVKELKLKSKPPALTLLCKACSKIGQEMPIHFSKVQNWSISQSEHNVRWDGDLICSLGFNVDGFRLTPENGTCLYHTFVVHRELFNGLD